MTDAQNHRAIFVVPPQVHLLDLTGPAHLFYEAKNYGAAIELYFVSLNEDKGSRSSAGLMLTQLEAYDRFQLGVNDWLFIPGIEWALLSDLDFHTDIRPFYRWLAMQHKRGAKVCSVCTGAFLLAEAGILDGRKCTTHWRYINRFRQMFPAIRLDNNRLFIRDGTVYSSAGISSGIDLALFLLEESFGGDFALQIAKEVVVYLRRTEEDPQLSIFLQYRNHIDARIHQAQDFMLQHIHTKFTVEEIAAEVKMSRRNLTRLFKKSTHITIGAYLEKLRVERAVHLLAQGYKLDDVAKECGLRTTNQMRSLLKKHSGVLPLDIDTLS